MRNLVCCLTLIILCLVPLFSFEQVVTAGFTGPDSICAGSNVQFTNTSIGATSYLWSFCAGFKTNPTSSTVNIINNTLDLPVFIDYGLDANGNYYGVVTNHLAGSITRLNFGNSLLNSPTAENLGDFNGLLPEQIEGVQLEHVNGKWYAIAVGGGNEHPNSSPRIIKLDFGNSLANTPTATNWGNIGSLNLPIDFSIVEENGNYYGFTMNVYSNTITRFDFGNDFVNAPIGTNLGNIGNLDYPDGFTIVKNNNDWYALAVNTYSNAITRLKFGSSITNTPTADVINNPGNLLSKPRDITMLFTCNGIFGYVLNANDDKVIKLNFGTDITSNPAATDLGSFNNNFPHSFSDFFTDGNDIYTFVPNVNSNSIDRFRFAGCHDIPGSIKQNPDPITYTNPGTYTVNLMVDIGLPTQTSFCKQLVVNDCTPPVTASFTGPDTVCVGSKVKFKNTSVNATNYLWSFCSDFKTNPTSKNIGNLTNTLYRPVFIDYGLDANGNYYGIVTNHVPGKITRLNFGKSLLNTPTAQDLGDFNGVVPTQLEGLQVVNVKGHWYAIAVGGGNQFANSSPRIIKLDFGNSLTNTPVATDWGNIGNLDLPIDFYIAEEKGNYYGFTMNVTSNTITRFDFGNDFINAPTGTNLGNIGNLNYPDGFTIIKDKNDWYVLAVNTYSNAITRLKFGSSLTNTPTADIINNPGNLLAQPRDITILFTCNGIFGYVLNATDNKMIKLNFGSDITSTPTATDLGSFNYSFPHSFSDFFTDGNDIYAFIPNVNSNSIARIKFAGCQDIPGSTKQNPDSVTYTNPGTYTVNLMVDIGLPTQTSFCKQLVVKNCNCDIKADFTYEQTSCDPEVIQFHNTTNNADSIRWDFGNGQTDTSQNPIIKYDILGNYVVNLYAKTTAGCVDTLTDTISVSVQTDNIIINGDTTICVGNSVQFAAVNGLQYCWSPGESLSDSSIQNPIASPQVTTTYYLNILAENGQPVMRDSVTITVNQLPVVSAGSDQFFCKDSPSAQLNASGADTYTWTPTKGLSETNIANPLAFPDTTTTYYVTGTDKNLCSSKDSVVVTTLPAPVFTVNPQSGLICIGDTIKLTATGGNIYNWTPSQTILNASDSVAEVIPVANTLYQIIIINTACKVNDTLTSYISLKDAPAITITKSNDIDCINQSAQLIASGGINYIWTPNDFITNTSISNPVVNPPSDTWYYVNATGNNGCKAKDSILVKSTINADAAAFEVAGAFTPNHDGLNDCFSVKYWGPVDFFDMSIYDRWGYLVYHSNNISSCWDGTIKGQPQGSGTYVYKISVSSRCTNNLVVHKKGTLVLIR